MGSVDVLGLAMALRLDLGMFGDARGKMMGWRSMGGHVKGWGLCYNLLQPEASEEFVCHREIGCGGGCARHFRIKVYGCIK
jgi:hypothetical protein